MHGIFTALENRISANMARNIIIIIMKMKSIYLPKIMGFTYPKTEFGETSFPLQLLSGSPSGFQLLGRSRAAAGPLQHWLEKKTMEMQFWSLQ